MRSLRLINSKSKWARNAALTVSTPLAWSWNLVGYSLRSTPFRVVYGAKKDRGRRGTVFSGFGPAKHGTSSKTKWKRLVLLAAKPLVGYGDVLYPGLRIHDRCSRGHVVTVATLSQMSLGRPIIICPTNRSSSQKVAFSLKNFLKQTL